MLFMVYAQASWYLFMLRNGLLGCRDDRGAGCEMSLSFLVSLVRELALQAKQRPLTERQQQVLQDVLQVITTSIS